ncbi:MAG: polyprenyl synthetase family protein [Chloroflexota bacterium]|nr:polyprenyl synthetase family protein [Chloroflexota bacterium]
MNEAAALVSELPARYAADLDRVLRGVIGEHDDPIHRMARYHLGWVDEHGDPGQFNRGKGLRSTLCLLACEALSGDYRPALPAAVALDLIHNFTLSHDDVMDRDVLRRGRASVWKLWGVAQAINVGDLLCARAFTALGDLASPETIVAAHRMLADTCVAVVQGQSADIAFEGREDVSVDEYLDMISRKTAALIGASLRLGALAAGAPPTTGDGLADLGLAMGIAFQIRDDMLGAWGDPAVTGKPVGQDLRRKKKTLPVLALRQAADAPGRARLAELLAADEPADRQIQAVLELMERFGVREQVRGLADEHAARARTALGALPAPLADRPEFAALIDYFTTRRA